MLMPCKQCGGAMLFDRETSLVCLLCAHTVEEPGHLQAHIDRTLRGLNVDYQSRESAARRRKEPADHSIWRT